jgi:3-hydroxyisobutyrate dehydrogenase-like beta-hydroxyacid dehydrogenase
MTATRFFRISAANIGPNRFDQNRTDDDALAEVALGPEGLAAILKSGTVHISTSTVSPGMSRRVAEEHARHGQGYIAARARKLFVLAAGPPAAMDEVRPLLDRLGQRLFVIGEDAASANLVKLAANVLTATTLDAWARCWR